MSVTLFLSYTCREAWCAHNELEKAKEPEIKAARTIPLGFTEHLQGASVGRPLPGDYHTSAAKSHKRAPLFPFYACPRCFDARWTAFHIGPRKQQFVSDTRHSRVASPGCFGHGHGARTDSARRHSPHAKLGMLVGKFDPRHGRRPVVQHLHAES